MRRSAEKPRLLLTVECYAGYKADERPLRFTPGVPDARTYQVIEVLDQWYGVGYRSFRVRADDGNRYILRHDEREDVWTLDSFRPIRNDVGSLAHPVSAPASRIRNGIHNQIKAGM